ncbi:MAG TPA: aspartate aminotransferase family protein [Candidatus Binatia bacterium]|nr:aspartate aminotransferase family protein [Candidatus Binatia bacterium]
MHPFDIALKHAKAFRAGLANRPPRPTIAPPDMLARFNGPTPERGEDGAAIIEALAQAAEPGLMAMAGPRFFGWVIGASHETGVAADMLTSAWGQNAGMYAGTPAAAIAEKVAGDWLLDILRLPRESSVGFVTGATIANFVGLAAARNEVLRRVGWDVEAKGLQGAPHVRVLIGADAHTTVYASLRFLGFGSETAEPIATDAQGRMKPEALSRALAQGAGPAIVIGQAGQINTGAFDPIGEMAKICHSHGAWLHIDGAFGLWARAVPEMAPMVEGLDQADSWATDGHKWLQLPYDCGLVFVRDREAHRRAMTIAASYLPKGGEIEHDPSLYAPELSRRARGFAAWAVIKALGREGIAQMVRNHCAFSKRVAERVSKEPGIEVLNDVVLNQVILGFGDGDIEARNAATRAVIERLQQDNVVFAGGSGWRDRWVMRLSIISGPLTEADIDRLGDAIIAAWRAVRPT